MALQYDYRKDYRNNSEIKKVGEGHAKYEQAVYVINEIMQILNSNKYNDLEDFFDKNNNLQDFLKNNPKIQTAIKHVNTFGNPLNEKDFEEIRERLREITKIKQSFDTKDIKTTNLDNKEYNSMEIDGKLHYIDNSDSNKKIEENMRDIQPTQQEFQTIDTKKNEENMFKEIESKQEGLNLELISEINRDVLNDEEKELLNFAIDYQLSTPLQIKVDLSKGVMIDEENNIMKITKENGEIKIIKDEDGVEKVKTVENKKVGYQKQLKPNPNTIYSN